MLFFFFFLQKPILAIQPIADIEKKQIQLFAYTFHLFNLQTGYQIWPGFDPLSSPVFIHYPNTYMYGFGYKQIDASWQTFITHPLLVFFRIEKNTLPLQLSVQSSYSCKEENRIFYWGSSGLKEKIEEEVLAFMQERFLIFQKQNCGVQEILNFQGNEYRQVKQLAFIALENRLLTRILYSFNQEDIVSLLKDYIAVNQTRRKCLSAAAISWENYQQQTLGLAHYVSLKTATYWPSPFSASFTSLILNAREKQQKDSFLVEDARITRHYFVGAVLSWLLDQQKEVNWKYVVEKNFYSLQQLVERNLFLTKQERQERLERVQQKEEWQILYQNIAKRLEKEKINNHVMQQVFCNPEEVIVWLGLPSYPTLFDSYAKKSHTIEHVKILEEESSFRTIRNSNHLWKLRCKDIPVRVEEPTGESIFAWNANFKIFIDGQEQTLQKILTLPQPIYFQKIMWKHPFCDFETTWPGKIRASKNQIQIIFN